MDKLAIVILNWNGERFFKKFIPVLVEHSQLPGVKIWVVDNHSTDGSLAYLTQNYPDIETIEFTVNHGFAKGYALALEQIEASYYILLNSDVEVTANWLEPLIQIMDNNKTVGACMPKIKSYNQKEFFEYAGAAGGCLDIFGYPFCRGRILNKIEKDTGQYDDIKSVFWASGACIMIRSEAYDKAGALDSAFFAHMEEIDLCWRIKNLSYKILCNPASIVYHVGGGTLPNDSPKKLFLNYRNSLFMLFKNLPFTVLLPVLIIRLFLDGLSAMVYLLKGKILFSYTVLKSHITFYLSLPSLIKKRLRIKHKKVNFPEVLKGSLLIRFFIRKRDTFSKLSMH